MAARVVAGTGWYPGRPGYHMPPGGLQAADLKLSLARGAVGLEGTRGEN